MNDLISRKAAIDALERKKDKNAKGDIGGFYNKIIQNDIDALMQLPSAQPETTWIPETRAIPSDDDRVSLSETVTATYYDEENEEWSWKIVTVRDVLDSVCDEYTVLPSAQPEQKTVIYSGDGYADGHMVYDLAECPECGYEYEEGDMSWGEPYCPHCGQSLNWDTEGDWKWMI